MTDLESLAERARETGRLGIDTEFMGEGRYRPLLCLVQVAVPAGDGSSSDVHVLDPLTDGGIDGVQYDQELPARQRLTLY